MELLQGIILLLLIVTSYSSGNKTTIKAYVSKPVTLKCSFSGSKVGWKSADKYLYSYLDCQKSGFPYSTMNKLYEGVSSNCSNRQKSTSLTFPFITNEHDGMQITCEQHDATQDTIFLIKIIGPPTVQVKSVKVKIGEQAILKCNVEDLNQFHIVSLKWTQEIFGQQIEGHVSNESQLIFNNTTWKDTGNWTCTVMIKKDQDKYIIKGSGTFYASGVPIVNHLENVIEVEKSESKAVKCFIYSYSQEIEVRWYHESYLMKGVILSPSHRQTNLVNQTVQLPGYTTELVLENIKEKDFGKYTLYVYNKEGVSNSTFILRNKAKDKAKANNVLIIGITCAGIFLILIILIVICFWHFSVRKISPDAERKEYSSEITKSTSIKYIKDFNNDEFLPGKDEPIYAEIGYIDMERATALKATQNEYLSPKSVNSLKRIHNDGATALKATQNEYLSPKSLNSLKRINNEGTNERNSTENVYINPKSVNSLKRIHNEAPIG